MARILPSTVTTSKYQRIMVYSHDAYGLGNISRMLSICKYLLKSISNLSILLISGSPMLQSFRLPQGLDYIKLPCLNRGSSGEMAVKYLNADIESILNLRSELILAAAKNYQPDLVLVDKKPSGIQGELKSTIDYLKNYLPNTKFVLLLRDILDTPEKTIQEWHKENYYQIVESTYDRLLVVGMPEIFDLVQEYQFSQAIASKVRFCGYIRKDSGLKNRRTIRQELGIKSNEKLVLVTPGGGEDGYYLINNYLTGVAQNQAYFSQQKIRSLIFCGAEMSPEQQQQIYQQARQLPGVTTLEFTNDLMSYVNTADMVISMCGYNTITEVLQKGKKAIVVPRTKPGQEQLIRAQAMAKAGLIKMIHPNLLNSNLLMETLFSSLDKVDNSNFINHLDFAGLPRVADYISMLLFDSFYIEQSSNVALKSA
ncbi:glycosyltransferase [Pleurocapsa sp. CCALA 161]|uniref:glycosyltransferase family protein n=1 Tax=Pleurocapsa sp. CCALA 161 TaxID=2107688 RepID=UPI000D084930|nr:glycosyltransferase [Pleurocapsa sp. CCALA 161]PSB05905.1 glycosyltransferase [Pleurocapsa sp. CCALA 161]